MYREQCSRLTRRAFLKIAGGTAAGATFSLALPMSVAGCGAEAGTTVPAGTGETFRMAADLQRALQRPAEERRWAMVIDTRRCVGCGACTVACIAENNLPPGVTYRTVPLVESGKYPQVQRAFMPTNCMQCDQPPCVEAADAVIPESMKKRSDGIVEIDYEKMKGKAVFEAALAACPYDAALYFDEGKNYTDGTPALQSYETRSVNEYGRVWTRGETAGVTRKCHFCAQRLDAGLLPACVTTCLGLAMHFGDASDEESLVSEILVSGGARRLQAELGTEPCVYFVDDWAEAGQPPEAYIPANRPRVDCTACHSFGR